MRKFLSAVPRLILSFTLVIAFAPTTAFASAVNGDSGQEMAKVAEESVSTAGEAPDSPTVQKSTDSTQNTAPDTAQSAESDVKEAASSAPNAAQDEATKAAPVADTTEEPAAEPTQEEAKPAAATPMQPASQPAAVALGTPARFTISKDNSETKLSFTAPQNGMYAFEGTAEGSSKINLRAKSDAGIDSSWELDGRAHGTCFLENGQSLTIALHCDSTDASCTLMASKLDPNDLANWSFAATGASLNDGSFDAPTISASVACNVKLYKNGFPFIAPSAEKGNFTIVHYLDEAGAVIEGMPVQAGAYAAVIEGCAPYYGVVTVPFTLNATAQDVPELATASADAEDTILLAQDAITIEPLTLGERTNFSFTGGEGTRYFSFTAGKDMNYRFEGTGDEIDWAFYSDSDFTEQLDYDTDWSDFTKDMQMESGETLYISITGEGTGYSLLVTEYDIHDIAHMEDCDLDSDAFVGDGIFVEPRFDIYYRDNIEGGWVNLEQNEDFYISRYLKADKTTYLPSGSTPTEPGDYYAELTGRGTYSGTRIEAFSVQSIYDISNEYWSAYSYSTRYVGSFTPPDIKIRHWNNEAGEYDDSLRQDVDFEITGYLKIDYDQHYNKTTTPVSEPTTAGEYYAVVQGKTPYTGSRRVEFDVEDPYDIANCSSSSKNYWHEGEPISPSGFKLYSYTDDDSVTLREGEHFRILGYYDNDDNQIGNTINAIGTYYAKAEGIAPYHGTKNIYITVADKYDIANSSAYCNTATCRDDGVTPIDKPRITVSMSGDDYENTLGLVEGTDYQIVGYAPYGTESWSTNLPIAPGSYQVHIAGMGQYHGERNISLRIESGKDLETATISIDQYRYEYTGKPIVPKTTVTSYFGDKLIEGTHYAVKYFTSNGTPLSEPPTNPGSYRIVFTAAEGNDAGYFGQDSTHFSIYDPYDISDFYVTVSGGVDGYGAGGTQFLYTGSPIEPKITVRDSYSYDLISEGEDYTVSYADNLGSASASTKGTITITGTGKYKGSKTVPMTIVPKLSLSALMNSCSLKLCYGSVSSTLFDDETYRFFYTGSPIIPQVIDSSPYAFSAGSDFDVRVVDAHNATVASPVDEGTYYLVVSARADGRLTGLDLRVPFSIVKQEALKGSLNYLWYSYDDSTNSSSVVYVNEEKPLDFYCWANNIGSRLVEGFDYVVNVVRVSDQANASSNGAGLFKAVASGIGRFVGDITNYFFYAGDTAYFERSNVYVNGTRAYNTGDNENVRAVLAVDSDSKLQPGNVIGISGSREFTQGLDFEIGQLSNIKPYSYSDGSYAYAQLEVKGLGMYAGCSKTVIVRLSKSASMIPGTGKKIDLGSTIVYPLNGTKVDNALCFLKSSSKPELSVYSSAAQCYLVEGKDYQIGYTKNADGSSATITITPVTGSACTGSYTANAKLVDKFDIGKSSTVSVGNSVASGDDTCNLIYYGYSYGVNATVANLVYSVGNLKKNADYSMVLRNAAGQSVSEITSPGTYTAIISGAGNWTGAKTLKINVTDGTSATQQIETCTLTQENGTAIKPCPLVNGFAKPSFTLSYCSYVLEEGKDYTVEYSDNTKVGEKGCCIIKAIEGAGKRFAGERAFNFDICDPGDISQGYKIEMQDYTGAYRSVRSSVYLSSTICISKVANPNIRVVAKSYNGMGAPTAAETLDASHYTVSIGNANQAGIAYMNVTGANGYTGKLTGNFYYTGEGHTHTWITKVTKAATCTEKGSKVTSCAGCSESTTEEMPALGHSWGEPTWTWGNEYGSATATFTCTRDTAHKATLNAEVTTSKTTNASVRTAIVKHEGKEHTTSYRLPFKAFTTVKLATDAYTYDGKVKTPGVTVKYGNTNVTKGKDYTVSYAKGRKNVGTYKVTVTGIGMFSGTTTLTMKILPKGTSISKVTAKKKGFAVTCKKQASQTSGYQIRYATAKTFKGAKTAKSTKTSISVSKLKSKKTYYVQVRTYKKVGSAILYSSWSKTKSVKAK